MKRLLALCCLGLAPALFAVEPAPHFDDPGQLLPPAPWAQSRDRRLTDYERDTGIKILVQFHLKSPPPDEDKVPGAYMSALSAKLGTLRHGVLVVYFADDPDWRVWVGNELAPTFAGKPGTVRELTDSGAMHDAKEAMLNAAHTKAEAAFAALQQSAPAGQPPTAAQHLALQADALLDALMAKLARK